MSISIKKSFFELTEKKIDYTLGNFGENFGVKMGATFYYKKSHMFMISVFSIYFIMFFTLLNFLAVDKIELNSISSYIGVLIGLIISFFLILYFRYKSYTERGIEELILDLRFWIISLYGIMLVLNIIAIIVLYGMEQYSPNFYFQSQTFLLTIIILFYMIENKNEREYKLVENRIEINETVKLIRKKSIRRILRNKNHKFEIAIFALHKDIIETNSFSPIDPIHFQKGGIFINNFQELEAKDMYIYSIYFINPNFEVDKLNEETFHEIKQYFYEIVSYVSAEQIGIVLDNLIKSFEFEIRIFHVEWLPEKIIK